MPYLKPRDRVYTDSPVAVGPGVHSDELSAAIDDLAGRISSRALSRLLVDGGFEGEDDAPTATVPNPPEDYGSGKDVDTVVPFVELFPVSALVTGVWGPDANDTFATNDLRRPNPPSTTRDYRSFWERMRALQGELRALRKRAVERYEARNQARAERIRKRAEKAAGSDRRRLLGDARKAAAKEERAWVDEFDLVLKAVAFVLRQEKLDPADRTVLDKPAPSGGRPFGLRYSVVAAKGNNKLPFASYSELPMATCLGAGTCRVPMEAAQRAAIREAGGGWCYSFKAFRYPTAWGRLFLNTLANYADREFAIARGGGPSVPASEARADVRAFESARARAALVGRGGTDDTFRGGRIWPQYVRNIVLAKTRAVRRGRGGKPARVAFMRLFVDGDVARPDCLFEWMEAIREMGPGGVAVAAGGGHPERHIEAYGYSKCWQAFLDLDEYYRSAGLEWPSNYTLNLSSGSVYSGGRGDTGSRASQVRAAMLGLPVTRGFFEAIPLDGFVKQLEAASTGKVSLPLVGETPFAFSRARIDDFVRLNRVRTLDDLDTLYTERPELARGAPVLRLRVDTARAKTLAASRAAPAVPVEYITDESAARTEEQQVRRYMFSEWLSRLIRDDAAFGAIVRTELARDAAYADEEAYLADVRRRLVKKADRELTKGDVRAAAFTEKALHDKALALALHEVLFTFGQGGSCPLICGNCSDRPDIKDPDGVHRCASKGPFRGKTIHIGLH